MKDPFILIGSFGPFNLWHRDKNGDDGACGWVMRAGHGNQEVLKRIEDRFRFDWSHQVTTHNMGTIDTALFSSDGFPAMSVHGIMLNLMFLAAYEHFGRNRKRAARFMQDNLFEILSFAENPTDSAHTMWKYLYGRDERETQEDRIKSSASMIYGWVLRATRPWYKHPRWHIHHWRFSVRGGTRVLGLGNCHDAD